MNEGSVVVPSWRYPRFGGFQTGENLLRLAGGRFDHWPVKQIAGYRKRPPFSSMAFQRQTERPQIGCGNRPSSLRRPR